MTPAEEIAQLWSSGTPVIHVVTREEQRLVQICFEAARSLQANLAVWTNHRGLDPAAPEAKEPLAALEALAKAPAPVMAVMLDFHVALEDPKVLRRVRDLLPRFAAEGRCLVVVASRPALPDSLASDAALLRLPLPTEEELSRVLAEVAADTEPEVRHRACLAAKGLSENQARRAFVRAVREDAALGSTATRAILEEKKRILSVDLGLEHVDVPEEAENVGGMESFKAWLDERALAFSSDAQVYGLSAPKGVLLLGVQGCGKSLAARYVSQKLGVPLLRLDLPRVLGAGGQTSAEESLARALAASESIAPVALWVDEIEKGFAGSAPGKGGDSRAARLLGAFSTWLQERRSSVFMVATANDVSALPPELLRRGRFDELFFVDLPDREARMAILSLHLNKRGRDPAKFELPVLAELCDNYNGAELEQVVVGALHRAFAQKRDVAPADLRRVAEDLVPLYKTYEEQIKALREWARGRARPAGRVGAVVDLFRRAAS